MAGIAVTAASRERLSFSRPYLRLPARFVMRRGDASNSAPDLTGKRVGVVQGSVHEKALRALFDGAEVIAFPRQEEMLAALDASRLDAAFGDGMKLAAALERIECCAFAGGPYMLPADLGSGLAVAVRIGDDALASAIDAALQQISAKGIFAELYLRYFPTGFY